MPFWFNSNGNVCVGSGGNPILCATAPCYDDFAGGVRAELALTAASPTVFEGGFRAELALTAATPTVFEGGVRIELTHGGLTGP